MAIANQASGSERAARRISARGNQRASASSLCSGFSCSSGSALAWNPTPSLEEFFKDVRHQAAATLRGMKEEDLREISEESRKWVWDRRFLIAADLDTALLMLCANESGFINGAVLQADDGFSL